MQFETNRLLVRSWQETDVDRYAEIIGNPLVMKYIGNGNTQDRDYAKKFVSTLMSLEKERGWILWAVENKHNRDLMGFCGFSTWHNNVEIGWRLDNLYWGEGYGTEAAIAVLNFGRKFSFLKIVSIAQKPNLASIRIMQKIGLEFEREAIDERCNRKIVVYAKLYP